MEGVAWALPKNSAGDATVGPTANADSVQTNNDITVVFDSDFSANPNNPESLLGNCDPSVISSDPTAVVMNVTVLGAGNATFVTVYPWELMERTNTATDVNENFVNRPFVSQLNPIPNHHTFVNMITVGRQNVNDLPEFEGPYEGYRAFRIYNEVSRINVIVDVVGYYVGGGAPT